MLISILMFPLILIFLYNYLYSYFPEGKYEEKLAWITFLGGYIGSFFTISGIWFQIKILQKQNDREKFQAFFLELLFYIKKTKELSEIKNRGFLFQREICHFQFIDPEIEKEDKYFYGDLTLFFLENKNKIFALPFNDKLSEIIYKIKEIDRLNRKINEIKPKLKIIDILGDDFNLHKKIKFLPIALILRILKKISIIIDKYNNELPVTFLCIDEDLNQLLFLGSKDKYIKNGYINFLKSTLDKIEAEDKISESISLLLNKDFINFMEVLFFMLDDDIYILKYKKLIKEEKFLELISIKREIYKYYKIAISINGGVFKLYEEINLLEIIIKKYLEENKLP